MVDYDMENLEKVWRRVSPPAEEPGGGTGGLRERLAGLIRREAAGAAMYTLLAIKTKGSPAERAFRRAASDGERHEKQLQAEYFLLTGDTCPVPREEPSAPYLLEAARRQYIEELSLSKEYESLASAAGEEGEGQVFSQLSRQCKRRAASVRALIGGFF